MHQATHDEMATDGARVTRSAVAAAVGPADRLHCLRVRRPSAGSYPAGKLTEGKGGHCDTCHQGWTEIKACDWTELAAGRTLHPSSERRSQGRGGRRPGRRPASVAAYFGRSGSWSFATRGPQSRPVRLVSPQPTSNGEAD